MSGEAEKPEYVLKGGPYVDAIVGKVLSVEFYKNYVKLFFLSGNTHQTLELPVELPYSALELGPLIVNKGVKKFVLSFKIEPPVSCRIVNYFVPAGAGWTPLHSWIGEKTGDATREETQKTIQAIRDRVFAFNRRVRRIAFALIGIGGTLLVGGLLYVLAFGATTVTGEPTTIVVTTLYLGPILLVFGLVTLFTTRRLPYYLR